MNVEQHQTATNLRPRQSLSPPAGYCSLHPPLPFTITTQPKR